MQISFLNISSYAQVEQIFGPFLEVSENCFRNGGVGNSSVLEIIGYRWPSKFDDIWA